MIQRAVVGQLNTGALPAIWGGLIGRALRRARRSGQPVLLSLNAPTPRVDVTAAVALARRADDAWFCCEQPDRGAAVAALGEVRRLEASGPERFAELARRWRRLVADALAQDCDGPPGSGLAVFGGFAFAPDGGRSPLWRGFSPASLLVPEISLVSQGSQTWLTINLDVAPDDTPQDVRERLDRRMTLPEGELPLLDPDPVARREVVSVMPPAHYEEAVARAVQQICSGDVEKLVLAREVEVRSPRAFDPAAILGVLRRGFSSSFIYAVGRGRSVFMGATPELLIRRQGQRASTVALAGSTRRSADPAVDDHLGERMRQSPKERDENAIVARRIVRALRPVSVWVTAAPEPEVVRVANIQHLATAVRAQLASPVDAIALAGLLHPTPAVGAEPASRVGLIPALEGFDRGWYAGPVGWTDASGDGEFCVALRCALLHDRVARCYAGCGIVRDSDPANELAETEIKLGTMLPVLAD